MPVIDSDLLDKRGLPTGNYDYSAASMKDIIAAGASEYTLVSIANDVSSSVASFKPDMEAALKKIVESCKSSPRADNLMIRLLQFNSRLEETHGFKFLSQCDLDNYDDCLNVGGYTALYDAVENSVSATDHLAEELVGNDFNVNGIVFIITDGLNNDSTLGVADVKKALQKTINDEHLESLITILIGVGIDDPDVTLALNNFKDQAGLTSYVEVNNTDPKTLAKIAEFVKTSISSQSSALGSGGPSQPTQLVI
tara:strand:- start:3086 stop:3844 length:759 start_codon:yes stop_codon:yes gene_type:complete